MMLVGYLVDCAALVLLAVSAAYWLGRKIAVEGGVLCGAYASLFDPFFVGFLFMVLWPMARPTSDELGLIERRRLAS